MAAGINVSFESDVKEMSKDLQKIKAAIPRITSRAINDLAVWARTRAIAKVAQDIGQNKSVVAKTVRYGEKVDRFYLAKASPQIPVARLNISTKGIQFTDVAMAAINPWNVRGKGGKKNKGGGVKLRGGRFQKGAFKGKARGRGVQRVWLATSQDSPINEGKKALTLPRIGIRVKMARAYHTEIEGPVGTSEFRKRFQSRAQFELSKAGIR